MFGISVWELLIGLVCLGMLTISVAVAMVVVLLSRRPPE
jgi:hypothetical protein